MLDRGSILRYYKRKEIQKEIAELALDREIAVRYSDTFGRRPDIIKFPRDVFEFVKNGATSFHCSEERWENPMFLQAGMNEKQLNDLRIGWDLVIDIDCKVWKFSKLVTLMIVSLLKNYGIKSVSVKFSGNKGFHIAVPYEAFPERFLGRSISFFFPEAPRRIAAYLKFKLEEKLVSVLHEKERREIAHFLNKKVDDVFVKVCSNCGSEVNVPRKFEYVCSKCGNIVESEEELPYKICDKCGSIMEKQELPLICPKCGSRDIGVSFDISSIVEIDTLLISSRHMFRMAYSLHEKSGLVSLPIKLDEIRSFKKEYASPDKVVPGVKFLDRKSAVKGEASRLLIQAYDFEVKAPSKEFSEREFEIPETAVEQEFFPPCIKKILAGLEDGRKRSLFILQNFLSAMGWGDKQIEALINEWNQKNKPPLKQVLVNSAMRSFIKRNVKVLPPNCDKDGYYKDIHVCFPDNVCNKIKNPVQYYKRLKRVKKK